jgi:hypothetical protein
MPNDVPRGITEDDREASVRRLQEACAEGHISHAEMNDHLQAVLTAKTPGDLVPVLASLRDGEIVDVPVARTTARHASVSPPVLTTQPAPESAVATEWTSRCSRAGAE